MSGGKTSPVIRSSFSPAFQKRWETPGAKVKDLAGAGELLGLAFDLDADAAALDGDGLGLEVVDVHRRADVRCDGAGDLEALAARRTEEGHALAVAVVDRVG